MTSATFSPVARRSVGDDVHDQLRGQILDGTLEPGEALPGERRLSERFAVNRHAVREALRRLEQAGLVTVTHGGATRVNAWRETAGLQVLVDLGPDPEVVRSALEMRRSIGVDVARLCALRHEPALVAQLREAIAPDPDAYARLWGLLVDGSGNLAYRLALNSLRASMLRLPDGGIPQSAREWRDVDAQRTLVDAVASRDAEAVVALTHDLLTRFLEDAS